jgi:hypothetical protein
VVSAVIWAEGNQRLSLLLADSVASYPDDIMSALPTLRAVSDERSERAPYGYTRRWRLGTYQILQSFAEPLWNKDESSVPGVRCPVLAEAWLQERLDQMQTAELNPVAMQLLQRATDRMSRQSSRLTFPRLSPLRELNLYVDQDASPRPLRADSLPPCAVALGTDIVPVWGLWCPDECCVW